MNKKTDDNDNAGVNFIPPMAAFLGMGIGSAISVFQPLKIINSIPTYHLGIAFSFSGLILAVHCMKIFRRIDINITPNKPTKHLLVKDIYNYSRNPMYIGLMLIYVGFALLMNNMWVLLGAPILFAYINFNVIPCEEAYLERKFGEKYLAYKEKVKRWI